VRLPFLAAAALAVSSACSAPGALVTPVPLVVEDQSGARIRDVRVERSGTVWRVSGWIAGTWLRTPSRRGIEVESFDAAGAELASLRTSARRYAAGPSKIGVDSGRFEVDVPDSGNVARIRISADPR